MSNTGRASSSHGPMMANSCTLFESSRNMLSAMPSRSSHKPLANDQSAEIGRMTLLFRLRTPRCFSLRGLHPNVSSSGTPQHCFYQWQNAKQAPPPGPPKKHLMVQMMDQITRCRCDHLRCQFCPPHPRLRNASVFWMRQLVQCCDVFANPLWSSVLRGAIARHARLLVMWVKQRETQAGRRNSMQAVFLLDHVWGAVCCRFGGQLVACIEQHGTRWDATL